jgi:Mg2+ and Co2+ transporter CorA
VIRLELLDHDGTSIQVIKPEDLSNVIAQPGNLLWIDLTQPTTDDWKLLAEEFQFLPVHCLLLC